jgi:phosphatidylserine decarboxylase
MSYKIHKEGYVLIFASFFILATIWGGLYYFFSVLDWLLYPLLVIFLGLWFFVVRFFRDPLRPVDNPSPYNVLSGADGKVVVIEEVIEDEYFKDKRMQVSVFMSPLDIHVNWIPMGGVISYYKYHPGKNFIASRPKSSILNERSTTVVKNENGVEILFRQIAGTVARRIVDYVWEGKQTTQGEEMGIIKFGSRFDFFLPLDADIKVELGQQVTGNRTVIARI